MPMKRRFPPNIDNLSGKRFSASPPIGDGQIASRLRVSQTPWEMESVFFAFLRPGSVIPPAGHCPWGEDKPGGDDGQADDSCPNRRLNPGSSAGAARDPAAVERSESQTHPARGPASWIGGTPTPADPRFPGQNRRGASRPGQEQGSGPGQPRATKPS